MSASQWQDLWWSMSCLHYDLNTQSSKCFCCFHAWCLRQEWDGLVGLLNGSYPQWIKFRCDSYKWSYCRRGHVKCWDILYILFQQGTFLTETLNQCKHFHSDQSCIAVIEAMMISYAAKAFTFYHTYCLNTLLSHSQK